MNIEELKETIKGRLRFLKSMNIGFSEIEAASHQEKISTLESVLEMIDEEVKKPQTLKVGDKGWIIAPSIESENYNDSKPRKRLSYLTNIN